METVAHFVPKGGSAQGTFDNFVEFGLVVDALKAQAVDDVLVNGLGEGVGLLEDHADALAQFDDIDIGVVDIDAVDFDLAVGDARAVDEIVHAIEAAQEGRLAAAGRPDEGGDDLFLDL